MANVARIPRSKKKKKTQVDTFRVVSGQHGNLRSNAPGGGLEAAVHSLRSFLKDHGVNEELCLLKIDMGNAFNECNGHAILRRTHLDTPELFGGVQWCYHSPGELRFGAHLGGPAGRLLGPLLFSLGLLELLDDVPELKDLSLKLWYLDDGTLVGPCRIVRRVLDTILEKGAQLGLHVNLAKCEVFWPSGDQDFPELPRAIKWTARILRHHSAQHSAASVLDAWS